MVTISYSTYFSRSCKLATKHYGTLWAHAALIALVYAGLVFAGGIAAQLGEKVLFGLMVGWILWIPLLGSFFVATNQAFANKPVPITKSLLRVADRFLGLVGALIGVVLMPSIVAAIAFGASLVLVSHQPFILVLGIVGVYLTLNTRLLSLVLVLTSTQDAIDSAEKNKQLLKGVFFTTMFRSTLSFTLLLALLLSPILASMFVELKATQSHLLTVIATLLMAILLPYLASFILVDLNQLKGQQPKSEHASPATSEPTPSQPSNESSDKVDKPKPAPLPVESQAPKADESSSADEKKKDSDWL